MARQTVITCDNCGAQGAREVILSRQGDRSVTADLCDACYQQHFGELAKKGRPTQKVAGRQPSRFQVVELPPQPKKLRRSSRSV